MYNLKLFHKRMPASLTMFLLANLIACTEFTPLQGAPDLTSQPEVRVTLTDQGRLDAAPSIGLRAQQVVGVLQAMSDSSMTLSVRKVSRDGGIEDTYVGEQLSLSSRDFDTVERSRTSVSRSLLAAGALVASAFLIAKGAGDVSGGRTAGAPPPTR